MSEQSLRALLQDRRCHVMGILNATPDSFSDGGRFIQLGNAIDHAASMVAAGAEIIDVGGESTRPGAPDVSLEDELARVIPVIEALSARFDVPLSVDTSKASVMADAVAAGAAMINDVRALQEPGALAVAAEAAVPVCLMHMKGQPRTMQASPEYADVVAEVRDFLVQRCEAAQAAGVAATDIVLDPGFGFGKTLAHNLSLLAATPEFVATGLPLLIGVSRKSMFGQLLGRQADERMPASVAAAAIAASAGARIVRAHDVGETVDAVRLANALKAADVDA